jgi:hypothetical protein
MGIETAAFHRRLIRKCNAKDERLRELYSRTCTVCGVQADATSVKCRVCGRQVIEVERDPVPPDVLRPVDPEQAQRLKEFYERLARQQKDREQAGTRPTAPSAGTTDVRRLPGESLPGEASDKRDWATALAAVGLRRLYRF